MWTCQCQTKNKLRNRSCSTCQSPVPPEELKRIYKYELVTARKALGVNHSESSVLKRLDEYADNDNKSLLEIITIFVYAIIAAGMLIYKNFRKILPYASIVAVVVCAITLSNPYSKHILRQKREISTARRTVISENMEYKLGTIRDGFSKYLDFQKTTLDGEEITKIGYVEKKIELAKAKIIEFADEITDKLKQNILN